MLCLRQATYHREVEEVGLRDFLLGLNNYFIVHFVPYICNKEKRAFVEHVAD